MNQFENMKQSIGVTAEASLMFLRAARNAGASLKEALILTRCFMETLLYGYRKEDGNE